MLHNFVFKKMTKICPVAWQPWKYDDNQSTLWYELVDLGATLQYFSAYFLNDPRKWFSLQYNTRNEKQQQKKTYAI